ncbi:MAG: lysophospholipid acyltransferase family protein [Anaerolineales bacterium]|jgi:KDO2-lipid IV(A) lauroyltransferase
MDLQKLATSSFGVKTVITIVRLLPPKFAIALGSLIANQISKRINSPMIRSIRSNQWVIRGRALSKGELLEATREVLQHQARCFFDLYRTIRYPEEIKELSPASADSEVLIQLSQSRKDGAMIVAPHLSNFDLVLLSHAYRGFQGQLLTYGEPTSGYEIQNELRASTGLDITPVRGEITHQEAIERMRNGGLVATAVDRPIRKKKRVINFFGLPSHLPTGHIRMALTADVPVLVAAAQYRSDGKYHLLLSDPILMQRHPDPTIEIKMNAEAVLNVIASFILQNPEQWLMYYPVWPDILEEVP